ncbi:hypothetical protein Ciccas_003830 [Cichlidogyrus casuarinus]|uniref:Uncharacterized protein n=1 Tax=Cichlidogyrus casuarinus TaxID=1844966 RepID=A0ABD2QDA2_9PLAT
MIASLRVDTLNILLKEQQKETNRLESRLAALEEMAESLAQDAETLPNILENLKNLEEITKKWEKVSAEKQYEEMQNAVQKLMDRMAAFNRNFDMLNDDSASKDSVDRAFERMQKLLDDVKAANKDLEDKYKEALERKQKLTAFKDHVQKTKDEFKKNFDTDYQELYDKFSNLNLQASDYLQQLSEVENKAADHSTAQSTLQEKATNLKDDYESNDKEYNDLKQKLDTLSREASKYKEQIESTPGVSNQDQLKKRLNELEDVYKAENLDERVKSQLAEMEERIQAYNYLNMEYNELAAHLAHLKKIDKLIQSNEHCQYRRWSGS